MSSSFCGGVLCRKTDRKFICFDCHKKVCGGCSLIHYKKRLCIDCFIEFHLYKIINTKIDNFFNVNFWGENKNVSKEKTIKGTIPER